MRKFVNQNVVKYTDNEVKANQLIRLGYKEVADDGKAPGISVQGRDPRPLNASEGVEVEKGLHTLAEPTTNKVEAAAAGKADERIEEDKPVKKTAAKK